LISTQFALLLVPTLCVAIHSFPSGGAANLGTFAASGRTGKKPKLLSQLAAGVVLDVENAASYPKSTRPGTSSFLEAHPHPLTLAFGKDPTMNLLKNFVIVTALAIGLIGASAGTAQAQDVEYGAITIKNPTPNTLNYQFKWGADSQWTSFSVPPGYNRTHYIPLDANRTAPKPYVRFDNAAGTTIEYFLEFYATFNPGTFTGKPYVFRYSSDGVYLNLYSE
jgi:hypothetical protein